MNTSNHILGKILYALLFLLIIPFMLCLWAYFTEGVIQIQIPFDPYNGLLIGLAGFLLLLWGMYALYAMGNGLPMNAYPPPKFVNGGPYRYFKHLCFVALCRHGYLVYSFLFYLKHSAF